MASRLLFNTRNSNQGRGFMSKKKAISKPKQKKRAAKTTKKSKKKISAKRKVSAKIEIPKVLAIAEVATRKVEQRNDAMIPVQDQHNDEFQDNQKTSRKRRRTSGQTFAGAGHEEELRNASAEVKHNIDEREKIRAPRRSQNQNRSR